MPINVTVSVTNSCNSRCKTCFIWKYYLEDPDLRREEFTAEEFERTFRSLGKQVFWATISGGEPYMRRDLPQICQTLYDHCRPAIMDIATNGLLTSRIKALTRDVLLRCPDTTLIVNISLDGIGEDHDDIRGIDGNFKKLLSSYQKLTKLKERFENLHVGIHSVISNYNIDKILDIYDFAKQLNPDSFITEIAENRSELFNLNERITPGADAYASVINELLHRVGRDYLRSGTTVSKITQAFRMTYYDMVTKLLRDDRQVVPCYAGYASCQITPHGDVWPCCVLGYDVSMGNLRETDYDFGRIWHSRRADEIRKFIREKSCACPLANAHYTNMLCDPAAMIRVLKNLVMV